MTVYLHKFINIIAPNFKCKTNDVIFIKTFLKQNIKKFKDFVLYLKTNCFKLQIIKLKFKIIRSFNLKIC